MDTHGTNFSRQRWWNGDDRHQTWGCAIDGQPTTALSTMPPAYDMGSGLLIMRKILNLERIDGLTWKKVFRQRCWRGDNRHQILRWAFDRQPTTALPSMPPAYDTMYGLRPADYVGNCKILNGSMDSYGTKFSRQKWRRGNEVHETQRCSFDGELTTALPSMRPD